MPGKMLSIEPLTQRAFADFGDVIETEGRESVPMNAGMASRFHALADVEAIGDNGHGIISLIEAKVFPMPETVTFVERHPQGSQAFIPMDDTPFLVVVAPAGEQVDQADMRAFITNGRQGINYHLGTWHHVLLTPFAAMRFICVDRAGRGNNCDEHWFEEDQQPVLAQLETV